MKGTAKYKTPVRSTNKVTIPRFMDYFKRFSKSEQAAIASQINEATFKQRWVELDKSLPDLKVSDVDIMNEVKAVRKS